MAEKPESDTDTSADEPVVYYFRNDELIAPPENTFSVKGSIENLFSPAKKPALKIYEEPES